MYDQTIIASQKSIFRLRPLEPYQEKMEKSVMAIQELKIEDLSQVSGGGSSAQPLAFLGNTLQGGFAALLQPIQSSLLDPFSIIAGTALKSPILKALNIPVIG